MRYLLDVNVLLAAIWKNHPDHALVHSWLTGKEVATCPISELGFLRISSNAKALNAEMKIARRLLEAFIETRRAYFLADDIPALNSPSQTSREVTDQYLAELAASKGMKLATLDTGIAHSAAEPISFRPGA